MTATYPSGPDRYAPYETIFITYTSTITEQAPTQIIESVTTITVTLANVQSSQSPSYFTVRPPVYTISFLGPDQVTSLSTITVSPEIQSSMIPVRYTSTLLIETTIPLASSPVSVVIYTYAPPAVVEYWTSQPEPSTLFTPLYNPEFSSVLEIQPFTFITAIDGTEVTTVLTLAPHTFVTSLTGTFFHTPEVSTVLELPFVTLVTTASDGTEVTTVITPAPLTVVRPITGIGIATIFTPPPTIVSSTKMGKYTMQSPVATVIVVPATDPHLNGLAGTGQRLTTVVESQSPFAYTTKISGSWVTLHTTPTPVTRVSTLSGVGLGVTTITQGGGQGRHKGGNSTTEVVSESSYHLTRTEYFVGAFLPTILAMLIGIPLSLIDVHAKRLQPFHALTRRPGGAPARDSLTLDYSGIWSSILVSHRLLVRGQPLTYITSFLTWCSWILVPLASEAVGLKVYGSCNQLFIRGCAVDLGVSTPSANALIAIIAVMMVLLVLLLYILRKWNTGVYSDPWSVAGIASLGTDFRLRASLSKLPAYTPHVGKALHRALENKRFILDSTPRGHYGIVTLEESSQPLMNDNEASPEAKSSQLQTKIQSTPFLCLTYWWRNASMVFHLGVLALLAYYYVKQERGEYAALDSMLFGFGFRFLYAAIGQIISLLWSDMFISKFGSLCPTTPDVNWGDIPN